MQRIMRAAEQLFGNRRVYEITLDEIAQQADVGKGTIYLYFSDKEGLIFQAAVAGFEEMCALLRPNSAESGIFRERLLRACENIVSFFQARRLRPSALQSRAGAVPGSAAQNAALPGVRAKGMTSRMFATPVTNISMRSKPRPKPACGTVP